MTTALERSFRSVAQLQPRVLRGTWLRIGFVYWLLFCIPVVTTQVVGFEWIGAAIGGIWESLAQWVGNAIFAIPHELSTTDNGSGDRTGHWVLLFCLACLAGIAGAMWSLVDQRCGYNTHDARLRELLRVVVRYTLGFTLIGYGVMKLFIVQFPAPSTARLLERYGDSSPMGLLWTFMGASPAYVIFAGALETLGAALLLFRRTTTLGALVLGGVMTNVVMMNFCYDVPGKINTSHYLAMCILLLLPELRRLRDVLWFHRATQPVAFALHLRQPWMRVARIAIKYGVIAIALSVMVTATIGYMPAARPTEWYGGYWTVARFTRDGQDVPAIATDATRWGRIRFHTVHGRIYARWHYMDESAGDLYAVTVDDNRRTLRFTHQPSREPADAASSRPQQPADVVFTYVRSDPGHFTIAGTLGEQTATVDLARIEADNMLLRSRGFHWINEQPYNR